MCLTELCGCGDEIDVEKELLDAIEESMKECIREQTGEDESENTVVGKVSLVNRAVEKLNPIRVSSRALVSFLATPAWMKRSLKSF